MADAAVDKPNEVRTVERVRLWEHGATPEGQTCRRKEKPIFTQPGALPNPCGQTKTGYDSNGCGGDEWRSGGIVLRDGKKNIIHKEP